MKVLVACEESQAVTKELRRLGHEAYSCDIIECSGGHPEWHIMQDVLPLLNGKGTDSPWHMNTMGLPKEERARLRSKTFPGVAKALAEQMAGDAREAKEEETDGKH